MSEELLSNDRRSNLIQGALLRYIFIYGRENSWPHQDSNHWPRDPGQAKNLHKKTNTFTIIATNLVREQLKIDWIQDTCLLYFYIN